MQETGHLSTLIPPHTSHKLQPLDRGVFGPFKKVVNTACDGWILSHPGKVMTIYDIPAIIGLALPLAATPKNIVSSFSCTGIFPLNREIFSELDFSPSVITEQPSPVSQSETVNDAQNSSLDLPATRPTSLSKPVPGTSTNTSQMTFEPERIRPFPQAGPRKPGRRKKRKSAILTDTPVKSALEAEEKMRRKPRKALEKQKSRRKIVLESDSEPDTQLEIDNLCLYCNSHYDTSKQGEGWIMCSQRRKWAHDECAEISDSADGFNCELCG